MPSTTPHDLAGGPRESGGRPYVAWVPLLILFGVASVTAVNAPLKLGFVGAMAALAVVQSVIPATRTYSLRGLGLKDILNALLNMAWVAVYLLFYGSASLRWLTLVHGVAVKSLADAAAERLVPIIRRRAA